MREKLAEQLRYTGVNFFSGSFVFGDMPHVATCRPIELFADHVIPVLADFEGRAAVVAE